MDSNSFNLFCSSLPSATYVNQWRGSHVWKISHKVFAIGNWHRGRLSGITFKASEVAFEHLKDVEGIRPAPYFASRGLKWLQYYVPKSFPEVVVRSYIRNSHQIVASNLPRKLQKQLGLYLIEKNS